MTVTTIASAQGLSGAEVTARRAHGEGNAVPLWTSRSYGQILGENLFTFVNVVFYVLGLALVALGELRHALVAVGMVLLSSRCPHSTGRPESCCLMSCPYCQSTTRQVKHGRIPSGSQRSLGQGCTRTYTPEPTPSGYDAAPPGVRRCACTPTA